MKIIPVQAGMVGFIDGMEHVHIEKYSYGGNVSHWLMKARQLLWVIESRIWVWNDSRMWAKDFWQLLMCQVVTVPQDAVCLIPDSPYRDEQGLEFQL